jgi:rhomboid protease GluP
MAIDSAFHGDAEASICETVGMEREEEYTAEPEEEWVPVFPEPVREGLVAVLPEGHAHLWGLVLTARSVACRIEPGETGWSVLVPASAAAAARRELSLFEDENRNWPPPVPPGRPLVENTLGTLSILFLLATFHNVTQLDTPLVSGGAAAWDLLGNADSGKILSGQWWRLVTALTVHADWLHLFSNLAIGGFFVLLLCREIGSGLAWSLLLASGILGNLANAWVHGPDHRSIGSSTLVFGALGILAAINSVRYRRNRQRRWALPAAAALALLADLGTEGKNTDLGAHLFGFVFGILLGMAAEQLAARYGRPGRRTGLLLSVLSAVVVAAAWWSALAFGR